MTDRAQQTKILRAYYSACTAYPEAALDFLVREAAKRARVSTKRVYLALESE